MKKNDTDALVAGLRKISEGFALVADAIADTEVAKEKSAPPKTEPKAKAAPTQPKAEKPAEEIPFQKVRGTLSGKAAQGHGPEVKALLHKYNVSCLTELEGHPELFSAIMKDAEVIGNA